jgi:hypothetical protein
VVALSEQLPLKKLEDEVAGEQEVESRQAMELEVMLAMVGEEEEELHRRR